MYYLILAVLLILISIYIYKINIYESYNNVNTDIGNVLSAYYCKLIISILKKEDFIYSNDNEFISSFPKYIKWNEELYNELNMNNISLSDIEEIPDISFWTVTDVKYEKIHNIMKPTIHKIFDDTFTNLNLNKMVNYPIIHFRCADTPFIKHYHYYFQKYSYFEKAIKDIESKIGEFTNITILVNFNHRSSYKNKETCSKYLNKLQEIINQFDKKYNINIESNSNVDDFVSMFYAPAVISTISSFSFMSGFFGSGIYIQPNMSIDNNEVCLDCVNPYKGYNIPHNKVNDYHNVDDVYKLLIE